MRADSLEDFVGKEKIYLLFKVLLAGLRTKLTGENQIYFQSWNSKDRHHEAYTRSSAKEGAGVWEYKGEDGH